MTSAPVTYTNATGIYTAVTIPLAIVTSSIAATLPTYLTVNIPQFYSTYNGYSVTSP